MRIIVPATIIVLIALSCGPSGTPEENARQLVEAQCSCLEPVVQRVKAQHPELLRSDTTGEGAPYPISPKERKALMELIHADPDGATCFRLAIKYSLGNEYITDKPLYARYMKVTEAELNRCWAHLGLAYVDE